MFSSRYRVFDEKKRLKKQKKTCWLNPLRSRGFRKCFAGGVTVNNIKIMVEHTGESDYLLWGRRGARKGFKEESKKKG